MADAPQLDRTLAHRFFSADCFNSTWGIIDKADRTAEDDLQMLLSAMASLWHWTQRPDCTDKNLSIGYWLVSRVHAMRGEADNSRRFAEFCMEKTPTDEAFCLGYAHEALARAEQVAGNADAAKTHLTEAWKHTEGVTDAQDKELLVNDLKGLDAS